MRRFLFGGLALLAGLGLIGAGIQVDSSAGIAGGYGATNCLSASAVQLGGPLSNRISINIQNRGPNSIYIGFDTSVATTTGTEIPSGQSLNLDVKNKIAVYCIAATADQSSPTNTRYLEFY